MTYRNTIPKRKVQAIKDGGLLEYYPLEDNRFELGGFNNLKILAGTCEGRFYRRGQGAQSHTPQRHQALWACQAAVNRWPRRPSRGNGNSLS